MKAEIVLALGAGFFTATASICQRLAAASSPREFSFSFRLVGYLLGRPIWFMGIVSMIVGFLLQIAALRVGSLALVQPIIAIELLVVFGFVAIRRRGQVGGREWGSAVAMAAGLGGFLYLANPSGGHSGARVVGWLIAFGAISVATLISIAIAYLPHWIGRELTTSWKAAWLGIATATLWGFVAAIIKELSSHLGGGLVEILSSWSLYALLVVGAIAMFVGSNAFAAGPLAASQPGLTIVDPLVASILGVTLFGEALRHGPVALTGEIAALLVLVLGVIGLSHSELIHAETRPSERRGMVPRSRDGAPFGLPSSPH